MIAANRAPVITSTPVSSINENELYYYQVIATDLDVNTVLTYQLVNAPLGMYIDSVTGLVEWLPNTLAIGSHNVTVKVSDDENLSVSQSFTLQVLNVNYAPSAETINISLAEDNAAEITLIGSDLDGDSLNYIIVTQPTSGVLTSLETVQTYQPNANFNGSDSFSYKVYDGSVYSAVATVNITITPVNDLPVAYEKVLQVDENGSLDILLTGSDIEQSPLTYSVVSQPSNGQLTGTLPNLRYQPNVSFSGTDSFTYQVSDGELSSTASVTITVNALNKAPEISSTPINFVLAGSQWNYTLQATDAEGDSLTYAMTKAPEGAIFDNGSQQATWPTNSALPNSYDFEFTVIDAQGLTTIQAFSIEVLSTERSVTHEGTEFWLPVSINSESEVVRISGGTFDVNLVSHGENTEVVLEIAALGFSQNLSLIADQITTYSFDLNELATSEIFHLNKVLTGYALHISSPTPISAYLMNQKASSTDGFLGLPKASLGKEYIATTSTMLGVLGIYRNVDFGQYGPIVTLVATEDNTQIVIHPIMDIFPGDQRQVEVGTPIELVLNRGDVYNLETRGSYKADLTGTMIKADKAISVIGQMECANIPVDIKACDHIVEQLPPIESLGTEYFTAPLWGRAENGDYNRVGGDTFRVVAPFDNTLVYLNNALSAKLNQGEYFEFIANKAQHIKSSHPVSVTQFSHGNQYDSREGNRELPKDFTDPFMVVVPSAEQFLKQYTFTTPARDLAYNFANLIVPNNAIASIKLDGQPIASNLFTVIANSEYSFVQLPVSTGAHHINADDNFGLYIYGYDYYESYGYLGGMAFSVPSAVASLELSAADSQTLDDDLCVEATLLDQYGRPVQGARVTFDITGVTTSTAYPFSDANGIARYCYRASEQGTDNIEATINDLSETLSSNWLAGSQNQAPIISSIPGLEVVHKSSYSYQVLAVDPENEALTYELIEMPSSNNMTIDQSGLITWPYVLIGAYSREKVVVGITDEQGLETRQSFYLKRLNVFNTTPVFEAATINLAATVGVPYFYNLDKVGSSLEYPMYIIPVDDIDYNADAVFVNILQGPAEAYIHRKQQGSFTEEWPKSCVGCINKFKWIPENAGSQFFELGIRDARGAVGESVKFTVEVSANTAPEFVSFNPPTFAAVRYQYSYVLDIDNDVQLLEFVNLDDLRIVFEQKPNNMRSELVAGNGIQKLRIYWTPTGTADIGEHTVRFYVADRLHETEVKEFTINVIADNKPPVITSWTSLPNAEVSRNYQFQLEASDPEGDLLSYKLLIAPEGMTINETTGLVSWLPSEKLSQQNETLRFLVTDEYGLTTEQQAYIHIARFINRAPEFVPAYRPKFAKVGIEFVHQLTATDREGDLPISYRLSSSGTGPVIDEQDGTIRWTPTEEGSVWISAKATDGLGNYASRNSEFWYVKVLPASATLDATLELSPSNIIDLGETLTLSILPINETASPQVSLTVDGVLTNVDALLQAKIKPTRVGKIAVVATITVGNETIERSINVFVRDPEDITPPVVKINSPANTADITGPTEIFATAQDDNLVEVLLLYKPADKPIEAMLNLDDFTELYRGPKEFANQAIATLDTSMLLNGTYHIYLQATDANGLTSGTISSVNVTGDLKVGNFSVTLEDLTIPLAGFPISILRTYDSRRKNEALDFGYGWSLDYQNIRLQESDEPSKGWTQTIGRGTFNIAGSIINTAAVCIDPSYEKSVTITMANGDTEKFLARLRPALAGPVSLSDPNCYMVSDRHYNIYFISAEGTQASLVSSDGGSLYLVDSTNGFLESAGDGSPYPITQYTLTTRNGYIYQLNQNFGVEVITDPNGYTLTYSDSGIVHSSGVSVDFIRDAQNRVTSITTPNGDSISYTYKTNGELASVTDELSGVNSYSYNTVHGLTDMRDPLNRTLIKNIYNDAGRLIAQEDGAGNRTDFDHNIAGRQSVVNDKLGRTTVLYYDERGSVTSKVDPLNNITHFTFDAQGNQLSKTDALNRTTSTTYNDKKDALTQTDALANVVSYSYDHRGNELTITDEAGDVFTNAYTGSTLTSITDPMGNVITSVPIPGTALPGTITDALGNVTKLSYARGGRKGKETNALGDYVTYAYDDNGNQISETRSRTLTDNSVVEDVTHYAYDKRNRLIQTTDVLTHVSSIEYDLTGNETATVDALNRRTVTDYDIYGRVIKVTFPDASSINKSYDVEGNLLTEADSNGNVTHFEYDALNRVIKTTLADASFTQTEYDAVGQVVAEIDSLGNRTEYEYDLAGRRVKTTDALNNVHSFSYDKKGNMLSENDALLHTTRYTYDKLGRKIQSTFHNTSVVKTGYDALTRRTSSTDQAGINTSYGYDAIGRLTSVTDIESNVTSYTYDEAGNKLSQTDAKGRITSWTYDLLGRVLTRVLPLGQVESFTYDAVGNRLTYTNFNGELTSYSYDNSDRIALITYGKDNSTESFSYDNNGNRLTATSTTGTWSYTYDSQNRLSTETKPNGEVLSYSYDGNGNKTQLTVTYVSNNSSNNTIRIESFTYDALNRLTTVTDNDKQVTTYSYDAVGNRSSITHSNANITNYSYDELNRLTQLQDKQADNTIIQQFDYVLDNTGRRSQLTELSGRVSSYGYDSLYRLTTETITDLVNGNYNGSYSFDKVGNRIESVINGVTTAYTYDDNDRVTLAGSESYSYDENGSTLTKTLANDVTSYSFDAKQKLTSASISQGNISTELSYQYNVDGIRTQKVKNGIATNYLVDGNRDYAQVIAETDGNSLANVEYTFGNDLLSQKRNATTSSYLYDGLGSTRNLTDASGNISDSYYYDAFGNDLAKSGNTENNFLYTGEQFDDSLDQYYLRARYYDQGIGRFSQQDTWMGIDNEPNSLNKYVYVENNPQNLVDPSGHFGMGDLMAAISVRGVLSTVAQPSYRVFIKKMGKELACVAVEEMVTVVATEVLSGAGVYLLQDDGKAYVGRTNNYDKRYKQHINNTKKRVSGIFALFHIEDKNSQRLIEQFFMDLLDTRNKKKGTNKYRSIAENPRSSNSKKLKKMLKKLDFC